MDWETLSNSSATLVHFINGTSTTLEALLSTENLIGSSTSRLISRFMGNDYLASAIVLGVVGFFFNPVVTLFKEYWSAFTNLFYVSVRIDEDEEAFTWFEDWMADNAHHYHLNSLVLETKWAKDHDAQEIKANRPDLKFIPGRSQLKVKFRGTKIKLWRSKDHEAAAAPTIVNNDGRHGGRSPARKNDYILLSACSFRPQVLKDFVNEVMEHYYVKKEGKTSIYIATPWNSEWETACTRIPRPFSSVILAKGQKEDLLADVEQFRTSVSWYEARGIPYRRGYLLHGPPGTGKTSFIVALAGEFRMPVCVVNLTMWGLSDTILVQLLNNAPKNAILLFEDIDSAFPAETENEEDDSWGRVTLSGVLNALDGIMAQEGCIVFMTTNHINQLAPSLIRPGRCDRKLLFDYADEWQVKNMFLRFFAPTGEAEVEKLADKFTAMVYNRCKISPAQLQSHFMRYRHSAIECLEYAEEFVKECQEDRLREERQEEKERDKKERKRRRKERAELKEIEEDEKEEKERQEKIQKEKEEAEKKAKEGDEAEKKAKEGDEPEKKAKEGGEAEKEKETGEKKDDAEKKDNDAEKKDNDAKDVNADTKTNGDKKEDEIKSSEDTRNAEKAQEPSAKDAIAISA